MDLSLRGKVALVTGGSRGVGKDIAFGFAEEGVKVAICARDADELESAAGEVRARGGDCVAVRADLSVDSDCRRAVDDTVRAFGCLDILVNNASTNVDAISGSIEQMTDDQVLARLHGKTMSAVRCSRAALPHLRHVSGGRIICIGGTSARSVFRGDELIVPGSSFIQSIGNSSLTVFAKHLAEEVARDGILVNVIHSHVVQTGRHPMRLTRRAEKNGVSETAVEQAFLAQIPIGRVLDSADIVPFVLLLASPLSGGMTGQAITIDGGALRAIPY